MFPHDSPEYPSTSWKISGQYLNSFPRGTGASLLLSPHGVDLKAREKCHLLGVFLKSEKLSIVLPLLVTLLLQVLALLL